MTVRSQTFFLLFAVCTAVALSGGRAYAGEVTGRGFPIRAPQTNMYTLPTSSLNPDGYSDAGLNNAGLSQPANQFSTTPYAGAAAHQSSSPTAAPRVQSYNPNNPNEVATLAPLAPTGQAAIVSTPLMNGTQAFEAQPISFPENTRKKRTDDDRREFVMPSIWPALLSVMVVCGLFCAALVLIKKYLPGHKQLFSHPAMEVLGRTHLDQKRYVSLLRVGKRIVVIGVTPEEMRPLSEITDEEEITSIMEVARPKTEAGLTIFQKLFKRNVLDVEAEETRAMARVRADQLKEEMSSLRQRVQNIGRRGAQGATPNNAQNGAQPDAQTEMPEAHGARRRRASVDAVG